MCSRADCQNNIGRYIRFRTPYGYHEGIIEGIRGNQAIILSPKRFIPAQMATEYLAEDEVKRLDLALAWGAPGRYGAYGGAPGYGGYGGYGGGWGYGWGRWAVSFLTIYVLWGLLW